MLCTPKILCLNLTPSVMVFEEYFKYFNTSLGSGYSWQQKPMNEISALTKKEYRELPCPFHHMRL